MVKQSYRNPTHKMREGPLPPGTPRRELTELYHLENISEWLKYIFWALIFGLILILGLVIRVFVSYL